MQTKSVKIWLFSNRICCVKWKVRSPFMVLHDEQLQLWIWKLGVLETERASQSNSSCPMLEVCLLHSLANWKDLLISFTSSFGAFEAWFAELIPPVTKAVQMCKDCSMTGKTNTKMRETTLLWKHYCFAGVVVFVASPLKEQES